MQRSLIKRVIERGRSKLLIDYLGVKVGSKVNTIWHISFRPIVHLSYPVGGPGGWYPIDNAMIERMD